MRIFVALFALASLFACKAQTATQAFSVEAAPQSEVIRTQVSDTIFYYYKGNNAVSAYITPWLNNNRVVVLFDPFGKETYRFENVQGHMSEVSKINTFHPNGAVAAINHYSNPGASINWADADYTFGINNEPEWMVVHEHPETLENSMNNSFYWDKKTNAWKRQEVVIETITPEGR
jgi:outer membrane biogenesis lipoprotein LolB